MGEDVSAENIGKLLERVNPDYVQYDCKGHIGWAGYPTKAGWPAPGIKKDSLAVRSYADILPKSEAVLLCAF